ncbi:hypothetical protein CSUB8523_0698 [Campylobacter subantarcticus LMG 24377]|uniref:Transcriptional regulator n=1 Tax=Campylobacter subantarcticus TaxID=497724 RepID=A0ABW9N4S7_9BACT|nr:MULTISPECIES: hypothetical protein [Campylobacter]AJC92222.1 hypothetical protein CSUB8523_0698 [Campylobacter subantarcticus LMG 24377]EAH8152718.1 hypothetical protein [Campylobacter lari]EAI4827794.1 hypothetical protein [Campylobacter lari]EAK0440186.1 hypothetical protein [Campylobacter lari]EAK0793930.1 hypothetical protein [Campylobacter lari]
MASEGLSDTRLSEITGIPLSTLNEWKKEKDRKFIYRIYKILKTSSESEIAKFFKPKKNQ